MSENDKKFLEELRTHLKETWRTFCAVTKSTSDEHEQLKNVLKKIDDDLIQRSKGLEGDIKEDGMKNMIHGWVKDLIGPAKKYVAEYNAVAKKHHGTINSLEDSSKVVESGLELVEKLKEAISLAETKDFDDELFGDFDDAIDSLDGFSGSMSAQSALGRSVCDSLAKKSDDMAVSLEEIDGMEEEDPVKRNEQMKVIATKAIAGACDDYKKILEQVKNDAEEKLNGIKKEIETEAKQQLKAFKNQIKECKKLLDQYKTDLGGNSNINKSEKNEPVQVEVKDAKKFSAERKESMNDALKFIREERISTSGKKEEKLSNFKEVLAEYVENIPDSSKREFLKGKSGLDKFKKEISKHCDPENEKHKNDDESKFKKAVAKWLGLANLAARRKYVIDLNQLAKKCGLSDTYIELSEVKARKYVSKKG